MKTRNIRCAMLLVAAALSLNASAQKNVLKAFEKFKTSKGVTIKNTTKEQGDNNTATPWRCNVVDFKVWKGSGMTFKMKALQEAFEKDSKDKNVTYFGQQQGLDENATEEEKGKYKKTSVRYNATDSPIVIGSNTAYNVLVLRSTSKEHPDNRIVLATEWRLDEQYGCIGTLYEIEGPSSLVRANTVAADTLKYEGSVTYAAGDDLIARMTFYRDTYDSQHPDTYENNALLLNMLEYLSSHAADATENEKAVALAVVEDMSQNTTVIMHKGILKHCQHVLEGMNWKEMEKNMKSIEERMDSYIQEFRETTYIPEKEKIIKRMQSWLRGQQNMDDATIEMVRDRLLEWKKNCTYIPNSEQIGNVLKELERRNQNGK